VSGLDWLRFVLSANEDIIRLTTVGIKIKFFAPLQYSLISQPMKILYA